jgi:DNA invertase Pin-like site-specific DNA recombinase
MRLDAVVRSSREGYREAVDMRSYGEQESDIRRWAKRAGHDIAAVHVERDTSGKTTNRAALRSVRERIESGETDGLVVAYTSRFSRNTVEGLELALWILNFGERRTEFYSLELEGLDFRSPSGEYILTNSLAIARQEWATKRAGFQRSREGAIAKGVHLSERFGYSKSPDGVLIPHETEAVWVPRVFERRAAGESWGKLAAWLNDSGVRPHEFGDRRDGKPSKRKRGDRWTPQRVKQLVESDVYIGVARSGDYVNADAHEALVSRELWERANALRDLRPRRGAAEYALSGLIVSGVSGQTMTGSTTHKDGRVYRYYGERSDSRDGARLDGKVRADAVEAIVAEEWRRRAGNVRLYAVKRSGSLDTLLAHRSMLIEAKRDHARDIELKMSDADAWREALGAFDARIEAASNAIDAERSAVTGIVATEEEIADPLSAPIDRKRRLFAEAFSAIVVEPCRTSVRVFGRHETPNGDGIGGRLLAIA